MRIAPADGYDFGAKKHYRRVIWREFRRLLVGQMANRIFALLPSSEGSEIDVAKANGAREHNLLLIDQNPAIVAVLKRRYPKAHGYGVTAARAADRIAHDWGFIDGVNLDLCGSADRPLFKTLEAWVSARVIADMGVVAVTVLRGREHRGTFGEPTEVQWSGDPQRAGKIRVASPRDDLRLSWISATLAGIPRQKVGQRHLLTDYMQQPYTSHLGRADTYRSTAGSQTFLYSIWQLHLMPCLCDGCILAGFRYDSGVSGPESAEEWRAFRLKYLEMSAAIHGDARVLTAIASDVESRENRSWPPKSPSLHRVMREEVLLHQWVT